MKISNCILLIFICSTITIVSCKSSHSSCSKKNKDVAGLWVGTYTVDKNSPLVPGHKFYFALSIYPDGTISYKSKGDANGNLEYISFADGKWDLKTNVFSFAVGTANYYTGSDHQQTGTATLYTGKKKLEGFIHDGKDSSAFLLYRVN